MSNVLDNFDETIHAPRRLAICAFLSAVDEAEFAALRDGLGISDSSLSKQIRQLSEAGYVQSRKTTSRGRVRTWVKLTRDGRRAFLEHRDRLRQVLYPESP